jgi:hypothetical protein
VGLIGSLAAECLNRRRGQLATIRSARLGAARARSWTERAFSAPTPSAPLPGSPPGSRVRPSTYSNPPRSSPRAPGRARWWGGRRRARPGSLPVPRWCSATGGDPDAAVAGGPPAGVLGAGHRVDRRSVLADNPVTKLNAVYPSPPEQSDSGHAPRWLPEATHIAESNHESSTICRRRSSRAGHGCCKAVARPRPGPDKDRRGGRVPFGLARHGRRSGLRRHIHSRP